MKESEVDVLVIGAGPAGLMCANGFAKAGVNVRIIDKKYATRMPEAMLIKLNVDRLMNEDPARSRLAMQMASSHGLLKCCKYAYYFRRILAWHSHHREQSYGLADRLLRDACQLHMVVSQ